MMKGEYFLLLLYFVHFALMDTRGEKKQALHTKAFPPHILASMYLYMERFP